MNLMDLVLRVSCALALGTLIGAEREWRHKLVGLKTNALVCVGAALFSVLGYAYPGSDPSRIAAQIASGIGFLGAGAIIRDGMSIRGLTTAATIWCAAAIGAMAGSGWMPQAVVGTVFIVAANILLKECARFFFKTGGVEALADHPIILTFSTDLQDALTLRKPIIDFLEAHHLLIRSVAIEPANHHMSWCICVVASSSTTHHNAETLSAEMADQFSLPVGWKLG